MKSKVFFLIIFVLGAMTVLGDVTQVIDSNLSNYVDSSGNTYNFSAASEVNYMADIMFNGTCSPNSGGCIEPYTLFSFNGAQVMGLGPMMNLGDIWMLPPSGTPGYKSFFPIYQTGDGLAIFTASGNYVFLVVKKIGADGKNITFDYQYNSQVGNTTLSEPVGCAADYPNETSCVTAMTSGIGCVWDSFMSMCRENKDDMGTGDFMGKVGCFIFDDDQGLCTNTTGCTWNGGGQFCEGLEIDGLRCGNITNSTVCTGIGMLDSCCSWSNNLCVQNTSDASCYENSNPGPGKQFCDDYLVYNNQSACDSLAGFPYLMPCDWDNQSNTCSFEFGDFFDGGMGGFEDIGTQSSCESAGGNWKTEVYSYTDSYGEHTGIDEWCEMGFGSGSCDASCWGCEFQPDGSIWDNSTNAQAACENSELGMCKFYSDSNAFNGFGWCDFPKEMQYSGAGDCDSDCGSCNFMNNPESSCNSSMQGCGWVTVVDNFGTQTWCESNKKKSCANDCFNCYDNTSCVLSGKGGSNECTWDTQSYLCKPSDWGNKEICFDGQDNDDDGNTDCDDTDCQYDQFCGGAMFIDFQACEQHMGTDNETCESQDAGFGQNCMWVNESFALGAEECVFPGDGCWAFGESNDTCLGAGCGWINETGCSINNTLETLCFSYSNSGTCDPDPNCQWVIEGSSGFCDMIIFATCDGYVDDIACNTDGDCAWMQEGPFGGFCDPICFNQSYNMNPSLCTSNPVCQIQTGFCEGTKMDCMMFNGNKTGCDNLGVFCQYQEDMNGPGPFGAEPQGFCDPAGKGQMYQGMQGGEPVMLFADGPDAGVEPENDLMGLGLKDNGNSYAFGMPLVSINEAAMCNGLPGFTGTNATNFYWYLDTDGVTTNNCNSTDGNYTGFEFKLAFEAEFDPMSNDVEQSKVAYRCLNNGWTPTPIIVSTKEDVMCFEIHGVMIAVEKESLRKFKLLFNESQDMRLYATSADSNGDAETIIDEVGPSYYTPGTTDFKFECCSCPGQDVDGDGYTSEQDPDCKQFNQYGYIPYESGPECSDGKDNDGNGLTDCDDYNCKNDQFFCSGSFSIDSNDKKTPKVVWLESAAFDEFAFVKFDTNEPSNGTLKFYNDDSSCANINTTLLDVGLSDSFSGNEYKPWHDVFLDDLTLGYSLELNTTYFYKLHYCDSSKNCGLSACLNFTTEDTVDTFVFDFDIPSGFTIDIPQLGVSGGNFNYGMQTNASAAKGINITVKCDDAGYEMTFVGVDIKSAKDFDLGDAFVCGVADDSLIGMNTSKWQSFLQSTGVDYLKLVFPFTGDGLKHCDDTGLNCQDVTAQVDCTFGPSTTTCIIPVATGLGFSTYAVDPVSENQDEGNGGSSSSSSTTTAPSAPVAQEPTTKLTQTISFGQIKIGDLISFEPNSEKIPVYSIGFESKSEIGFITMKASVFENKPEEIVEIENAYKYLELSSSGFIPTDVKNGKVEISFKVEKSWVDSNAADKDSLYMYRYYAGDWTKLFTKYIKSEGDFYYYKSETPGFSYFSIAADLPPEPKLTEELEGEIEPEIEIIDVADAEPELLETNEKPNFFILITSLALFVAAALLFFHPKKPKTEGKIEKPNKKDFLDKNK